jgi:hypothetical protein
MSKKLTRDELIAAAQTIYIATAEYLPEDFETVTKLIQGFRSSIPYSNVLPGTGSSSNVGPWDETARRFERLITAAAANGKPKQKKAMVAWLESKNGAIELKKLWKAAGVGTQHDYAGVGSGLTRNMMKARGPKDWYTWPRDEKTGEWFYTIIPELVEPLRRAFGIKQHQ